MCVVPFFQSIRHRRYHALPSPRCVPLRARSLTLGRQIHQLDSIAPRNPRLIVIIQRQGIQPRRTIGHILIRIYNPRLAQTFDHTNVKGGAGFTVDTGHNPLNPNLLNVEAQQVIGEVAGSSGSTSLCQRASYRGSSRQYVSLSP